MTARLADAEPLLVLLIALALDGLLGHLPGIAWLRWPALLARYLTAALDRRLNRLQRGAQTVTLRGALVVGLIAATALAAGFALAAYARRLPGGAGIEVLAVFGCLGARPVWSSAMRLARAMERREALPARDALQALAGQALAGGMPRIDEHRAVRIAVAASAKALAQRVVSPVFWYMLFGLPGLFLATAVDAMDAEIGHDTALHGWFGATAARLDTALGWLPSCLTAGLVVAAAVFLPTARPAMASAALRRAGGHPLGNAARPLAATAGALGLALGGDTGGGRWLGDGRARALPADLRRAIALHAVAALLTAMLPAALAIALLAG